MNDFERRVAWSTLMVYLPGGGDISVFYRHLVGLYSEPHRAYHNLDHLDHCLSEIHSARALAEHPVEVECALWFHDAHYDPRAHNNEELSAELAVQMAEVRGVSPTSITRVVRHIMATKHQSVPEDYDSQLVADIDLTILGQNEKAFDRYESQIRLEYGWVSDDEYKAGRSKIIKMFLARPQIYSTRLFQEEFEERARHNLERSLKRLGG